jgi:biopolymer transport protein ExbD
MRKPLYFAALLALSCAAGCDDSKRPKNPFDPPPDAPKKPPAVEAPKPQGPPEFSIDTISPKVGFSRVVIKKAEGKQELESRLAEQKEHIDGKDVRLLVDRKTSIDWVVLYVEELGKLGAKHVTIVTESREEFPKEVRFTPEGGIGSVASCSVVAMVMEDRSIAVWKLSGGVASRRSKGLAGPDLTMTAETLERMAKACRESDKIFVSAAEPVEWGLAYDLAASAKALDKVAFRDVILLKQRPVPGHKVEL